MSDNIVAVLRREGNAEFEGAILVYDGDWKDLQPGDTYVAERNSGPKLLTVREVKEALGDHDQWSGAVFPVENAYPFDLGGCAKVQVTF